MPRKRSKLHHHQQHPSDISERSNLSEFSEEYDADEADKNTTNNNNDIGESKFRIEPVFRGTLPQKYWRSPPATNLNIRGKTYMDDNIKVAADEPAMNLVAVDLLESERPIHNIAELKNCTAKVKLTHA